MRDQSKTKAQLLDELAQLRQQIEELERSEAAPRRAQKTSAATTARLKEILAASPAVIYTSEASGDYAATFISDNVKEQLGYEPGQFLDDPGFWASHIHPEDAPRVFAELSQLLGHGHHAHEYRFQCSDGAYCWMRDELKLICDAEGKPLEIIGSWIDITERVQAEEELRKHRDHLEELVEERTTQLRSTNQQLEQEIAERKRAEEAVCAERDRAQRHLDIAGVLLVALNARGEITLINRTGCAILGYEEEELLGKKWFDTCLPVPIREPTRGVFLKLMAGEVEAAEYYENSVLAKSGEERLIAWHNATLTDEAGRIIGTLSSGEDITERKRAEEAVQESEEKYRSIVETTAEWIWEIDLDGRHTFSNPGVTAILGYSSEEVVGQPAVSLLHEEDRAEVETTLPQLVAEKRGWKGWILRWRHKDGSYRFLESNAVPILDSTGHFRGYRGADRDITERKRAEEALRKSEERYRGLFDGVPIGLYRTTPEGQIVDANSALVAMLGYSDLSDLTAVQATATYVDAGMRSRLHDLLVQNGVVRGFEEQLRRKDGAIIWVEDNARAVSDDDGRVIYYEGSLEDITGRKRAEESLEKRIVQLALVNDVAREVTANLDLEPLLTSSARLIQETYGHPHVAIFLIEEDGGLALRARAGEYADRFPPDYRLKPGQGIVGWAAQEGRPLCVNDVTSGPRYYTPFPKSIQSELGIPLKVGDRILGVLDIQSDALDAFDEFDIVVLNTLGRQIATAIQNASLFEQAQMRAIYLASLNHASERVTRYSLDLGGVSHAIVSGLTEEVGVAFARLWVADQESQELVLQASAGLHTHIDGAHSRLSIADCQGKLGQIAREQKPILSNHVQEDDHFDQEWMREQGIVSFAGYPLVKDGQLTAVLAVFHTSPLEGAVLDVMGSFANQAAIALENAKLYHELANYNTILEQAVHAATAEVRHVKERLETILNSSPDAILLLTPAGKIETANPAFYALFGFDVDELFGRTPSFLVSPEDEESLGDYLAETVATGKTIRIDGQATRKDKSVFDAEVLLSPAKNEKVLGVVCSIRDITPLKEVERMKDAFVSNVSHELRTPITGLKLNHHLLGADPENQEVYYGRMGREIDRLNALIEDLLRLSRLDQGRVELNLEPTDLNSVAAQYVGDRAPLAESRGLTLVHEAQPGMPEVECDSGLLGQALSVLLTNAMNYTPSGGAITVRTQWQQDEAINWAGISVSDTGPGISPDDLPHLFERFFRGKVGRESGAAGTGLGLAIAREIMERHKGRIEVASEGVPGKGATFTLWLPALNQEESG